MAEGGSRAGLGAEAWARGGGGGRAWPNSIGGVGARPNGGDGVGAGGSSEDKSEASAHPVLLPVPPEEGLFKKPRVKNEV